jgi:hypothetical protein
VILVLTGGVAAPAAGECHGIHNDCAGKSEVMFDLMLVSMAIHKQSMNNVVQMHSLTHSRMRPTMTQTIFTQPPQRPCQMVAPR